MRQISHSQNFIQNQKLLETLIRESSITPKGLVIEIGAGQGEITKVLSRYAKEVVAIEKDQGFYQTLINQTKRLSNVTLLNQDIFQFNFPTLKPYKVFSNIPFNYTADILRLLTQLPNLPEDIYLFVQSQAALNYLGLPQTKESLKSLFVKLNFKPSIVHRFKRFDFRPIPKVDIVLMRLEKLSKPLLNPFKTTQFKDFVVYAFSQTKPNLQAGLKHLFPKDLNLKLKARPKDLSLEQWLDLFNYFNSHADKHRKDLINHAYQKLLKQQQKLTKIYRTRRDQDWKKLK